tara:strand:- start:67 stop:522 length:456 start_codon:yes stop_codon:yes gene_type:complete
MKKNPILMKATKGAPIQMNYNSPMKAAGIVKLGLKALSKAKNFFKSTPKYNSIVYSPNAKTYDKLNRYNPPITGKIKYNTYPVKGVKPNKGFVNVQEVTRGGKTTLIPGVTVNSNSRAFNQGVVKDMNKYIKKDKSYLNVVKDKFGNKVSR